MSKLYRRWKHFQDAVLKKVCCLDKSTGCASSFIPRWRNLMPLLTEYGPDCLELKWIDCQKKTQKVVNSTHLSIKSMSFKDLWSSSLPHMLHKYSKSSQHFFICTELTWRAITLKWRPKQRIKCVPRWQSGSVISILPFVLSHLIGSLREK